MMNKKWNVTNDSGDLLTCLLLNRLRHQFVTLILRVDKMEISDVLIQKEWRLQLENVKNMSEKGIEILDGLLALMELSKAGCNHKLRQFNIIEAINYYGITELLDTIGMNEILSYLDFVEKDT